MSDITLDSLREWFSNPDPLFVGGPYHAWFDPPPARATWRDFAYLREPWKLFESFEMDGISCQLRVHWDGRAEVLARFDGRWYVLLRLRPPAAAILQGAAVRAKLDHVASFLGGKP